MKITKKLLAVCVAALALSMALMGCNGGSSAKPAGSDAGSAPKQATEKKESKKPADDRIDFTWFKAYAPEGYDVWARSGSDGNVSEILFNGIEDSNKVISFGVSSTKDAETVVTNDSARDGYERGEDVTIGRYTWKTVNFTWHKTPSRQLATDIPNSGRSVEITLFMATPDDPAVKAFLESIEFCEEDLEEKKLEAKDISIKDLCEENGLVISGTRK